MNDGAFAYTPDYSEFWGAILNLANAMIQGLNNSNYTNINFSTPQAVGAFNEMAFSAPGQYDFSVSNGTPSLTAVPADAAASNGTVNSANAGNGNPTQYFAGNSQVQNYIGANQGGLGPFTVNWGLQDNRAFLTLYYASPGNSYMFKSYQWIQNVSSSGEFDKAYGLKLHNPHIDGSRDSQGRLINYPFYWTNDDLHYINLIENGLLLESFMNSRYSAIFWDSPHGESWFLAEVTLVGMGFNGMLTPLGSYSWGYAMGNNGAPIVLTPMFSPTPSSFQQNIIQNYNNRLR